MSGICEKSASERFYPEVRGWAALRLVSFVPRTLLEAVQNPPPSADPRVSFRQGAVGAVSGMEAVAWSCEIAARVPALGVTAGPACLARLWAAGLLRSGGAFAAYWPSLVDEVWDVVRPALEKMGVATRGPGREELRHEVAAPLALVFLKSLAAGRKDLRLVGEGCPDRPDGPPFGWAPGIDAMRPILRYLLLGQVPGGFRSHALLSSPLAKLSRAAGVVVPVVVQQRRCERCGIRTREVAEGCPQCGGPLVCRRERRLVARALVERQPRGGGGLSETLVARAAGGGATRETAVHEWVDALQAREVCIERARRLWNAVIRGEGHGVAARVVLGALAGVRPLVLVADRPPARRQWLEHLVETLVEGRLDREPIACQVNAALAAVAAGTGRRAPLRVLSGNVGVLATRFRRAILGPVARTP